jgi:Tol biopolymer transport system component
MPHEGHLYFHRYSSYEAWDGEIWRYDLASGKGEYLSENWPVDHAMNVRFDRDRKRMLFMGVEPDQHYSDAWDVYLWQVDSKEPPINLTKRNGLRDEDPQFSPDGREILFKQSGSLAVMNVKTREVNKLTPNFLDEQSMPIYLDANRIVFMQGEAGNSSIRMYHRKTGRMQTIVDTPETQDYFPVPWDARRFLFVRWVSPVDHHDQVYQWNLAAREQTKLPFCQQAHDYSDPFPIDDRRVLFSSTRDGGKGGYDLHLGDADDGTLTPIDLEGVNTPAEELASVYVPPMKK